MNEELRVVMTQDMVPGAVYRTSIHVLVRYLILNKPVRDRKYPRLFGFWAIEFCDYTKSMNVGYFTGRERQTFYRDP